uniref:NADH-ubiquinone oxidoreductase chain 6 n=1 Tax=Aesa media TaxID=2546595 RepID=A0A6H0N3E8_9CUCU|nr:NADH dehydrogenase subunit 6 [Aesa media]
MLMIFSLMCILSIFFMFMKHPLSFGLVLLMQTLMIALTTGMLNYNFWFSYILFLIMVGGMLVLFIYMTSIASNEKFKFSFKMMIILLLMLMVMTSLLFMDNLIPNMSMFTQDMSNQTFFPKPDKSMNKFMNMPSSLNLFMIIMYLLITLIMVVKITNVKYGPLRQKL